MITPDEKIQKAFGQVIYAVAMMDGEVQQVEIDVLKKVIADHEWGNQVVSSFEEEHGLNADPNIVFLKAMKVFRAHGPSKHYNFFIDLLEKIAHAHDGIIPEERKLIDRFREGLLGNLNN